MAKFRLKSGFKTQKQAKRLQRISYAASSRCNYIKDTATTDISLTDHSYSATAETAETAGFVPSPTCTGDNDWRQGRRVVELGVLADALSSCGKCRLPLHLLDTLSIQTYGLSAILKVSCSKCHFVNNIPTGKRHGRIWDANTKLASAAIHAGIGGRQINSILTTLNIPPVSKPTLANRQREIETATEDVAKESVDQAIAEEAKLSYENPSDEKLTVSVDGGWQKRGSGRSYDSLSGHCSMMGTQTGKIIGYSVRSKFCKRCDNAGRLGKKPAPHDCRCIKLGREQ